MKALFNRVLPGLRQKELTVYEEKRLFLYSGSNLRETQLKSVIGYLAMKISQLIDWEPQQSEQIFYQSFQYVQTDRNEKNDLLHLSGLLLNWVLEGKDIKEQLVKIMLPDTIEQAILNVYETSRNELEDFKNAINSHKHASFSAEENEWEIYRDIMYAATQRKLLLVSQSEIQKKCEGNILYSGEIKERGDVSICRKGIQQLFMEMGMKQNLIMHWLLAISELTTNCIKHADGGKITVKQNQKNIYIIVEDQGPGFKLKDLPNMTLIAGYSTKNSMGQGFNLMMKMAEQIMLSNTESGASLILKFTMKEDEPNGEANRQSRNI